MHYIVNSGTSMRMLVCFLLASALGCSRVEDNDLELVTKMGKSFQRAIVDADTSLLLRFVSDSGCSHVDTDLSRSDVERLIHDQGSWLYRQTLGPEKGSARILLRDSSNVNMRVKYLGHDLWEINYHVNKIGLVQVVVRKTTTGWFIDDWFTV